MLRKLVGATFVRREGLCLVTRTVPLASASECISPSLPVIGGHSRRHFRARSRHNRKVPMTQYLKKRPNVPQHVLQPMQRPSANQNSIPVPLSSPTPSALPPSLTQTQTQTQTHDSSAYQSEYESEVASEYESELESDQQNDLNRKNILRGNEKMSDISDLSARFFQQYFLSQFNNALSVDELERHLSYLKDTMLHKKKVEKTEETNREIGVGDQDSNSNGCRMSTDANLIAFEKDCLRYGFHSCLARIGRGIDMEIDLAQMQHWFEQMQELQLLNTDTFYWMLKGHLNVYDLNQSQSNDEETQTETETHPTSTMADHVLDMGMDIRSIADRMLMTEEEEEEDDGRSHGGSDNSIARIGGMIARTFNAFEAFIDANDAHIPPITTAASDTPFHAAYIAEQNAKYRDIYSLYIRHLLTMSGDGDGDGDGCLVLAINTFYDALAHRSVSPDFETQLLLLDTIARHSETATEIKSIFQLLRANAFDSPDISYYNAYLEIIARFGDIDEAITCLRLCIFNRNWYLCVPDCPPPNLRTFEHIFNCMKIAVHSNYANHNKPLSQDSGARKTEWILKQMKTLKIGAPASLYRTIYETIGVAFWESLPWHLRLLHRP